MLTYVYNVGDREQCGPSLPHVSYVEYIALLILRPSNSIKTCWKVSLSFPVFICVYYSKEAILGSSILIYGKCF